MVKGKSTISLPMCLGDELLHYLSTGKELRLEVKINLEDVNFIGGNARIEGMVKEARINHETRTF